MSAMMVHVRRVSVVGNSGSGKSRLAGRIAARVDAPHIELDAIYHQSGWEPIDPDEFVARVEEIAGAEAWVIDGNYRTVIGSTVWARADTVVWLDLPRSTVMRQVIGRTLRRTVRRERLWNGNREPLSNLCFWRDGSIIHWAWTQHAKYEARFEGAMLDPSLDHLEFVRLRSHREADEWLEGLTRSGRTSWPGGRLGSG